jgi:hypothetical protein
MIELLCGPIIPTYCLDDCEGCEYAPVPDEPEERCPYCLGVGLMTAPTTPCPRCGEVGWYE